MTSMCVYALMKRNVEELEPCNHITMHGIGLLDSFEQKTTPIFPAYYMVLSTSTTHNQTIKSGELRGV